MTGNVEVIAKIKQKNGADFKIADWYDIDWEGFKLPEGAGGADHVYVRYSPVESPESAWMASPESREPNTFMGICVSEAEEAPLDPKAYQWTRIKGSGISTGSGRPVLRAALGDLYIDAETGMLYEYTALQ